MVGIGVDVGRPVSRGRRMFVLIGDRLKAEPFKIAWESYANGNSDIYVMGLRMDRAPVNITS